MARGEQQQIQERRVVNTLTDQGKYDMPNTRGLRVFADPVAMPLNVKAIDTSALQLAEALGQLRPKILEYAIERRSDEIGNDIKQGRLDAIKGLPADQQAGEYRKYGYDYQTSYLKGEDLGSKLEADIQTKDPEQDFDSWYKDWWSKNASGVVPNDPEMGGVFNKAFTKSLVTARDFDIKKATVVQREKETGAAIETIYRSVQEIRTNKIDGKTMPITMAAWETMKKGMPGFTNAEHDAIMFEAIKRHAFETNDPEALDVFFQDRKDAKTGKSIGSLASNPKYTDQILNLRTTLRAKRTQDQAAVAKQSEATLAAKRNRVMLEMLKDPALMQDEARMRSVYLEFAKNNPDMFPPEDLIEEMNKELGYLKSLASKVEGPKEEMEALRIQAEIGKHSPETILEKVRGGFISPKQGSNLLTKLEEHKRHQQSMAKQSETNGLATRTFFVGQGHQIIKDAVTVPAMQNTLQQTRVKPTWERNQYLATIEFNDWVASQTKGVSGDQINAKAIEIAEKYRGLSQSNVVGTLQLDQAAISPYIPKPDQKMTQQ